MLAIVIKVLTNNTQSYRPVQKSYRNIYIHMHYNYNICILTLLGMITKTDIRGVFYAQNGGIKYKDTN